MTRMLALTTAALLGLSADGTAFAQTAPASPSAAQISADLQAQYDSDMVSYRESLVAAHREARENDAHYMHQRRAYADAMAAWRMQVDACHHGNTRACNAPTPDPADFY